MFFRSYVFLLLLIAAGATRAAGQPIHPDSVYTHPGVTVTATRSAVDLSRAPSRVTVLDSLALQNAARADVATLLEAHSGVFVRRYGAGGLSTVSMRGASPSQTLVLLDGQRISDPQLGQLDLSLLPSGMVSQIEVMHGPASALYGSDAVGGAVNLRTTGGAVNPSLARLSTGIGAFGERTASAALSATLNGVTLSAAVSREASEGDFPYLDRSRIPAQTVRREGADRAHVSAFATARYAPGAHRLQLSAFFSDAERGLVTPGSGAAVGERQWDRRLHVWSNADRHFSSGTLSARVMTQHTSLRYLNPRLNEDQTGTTFTVSGEAVWTSPLLKTGLIGVGSRVGIAAAEHPALAASPREMTLALFGHGTVPAGPLVAYPSARVDYYRSRADAEDEWLSFNPRLGLNLRPFVAVPLHVKASAGRSFRAPTFNDRFWRPGGNPHLRPERGTTVEGGVFAGNHTRHIEVTAFTSAVKDQITWLPGEFGYWSPASRSRIRSTGLEVSGSASARVGGLADVNGRVAYTYTRARDRSDESARSFNRPLRYVPAHQLKAHAAAALRPASGYVTARFTGARFVTTDASQSLPPYLHVDAGLGLTTAVTGYRLQLFGDVENLLDARYSVVQGYPMPPRHARIRLVFFID